MKLLSPVGLCLTGKKGWDRTSSFLVTVDWQRAVLGIPFCSSRRSAAPGWVLRA